MKKSAHNDQRPETLALAFATGRKQFKDVLATYLSAYKASVARNEQMPLRLIVLVCYDLTYSGAAREDFVKIDPGVLEGVDSIRFIGQEDMQALREELAAGGIINAREAALLFDCGYAAMRNALVYAALQENADYLLFIDDDEYPLAVSKDESGQALWYGQDVIGAHLANIEDAAITHGHHCGYVSPIPSLDFEDGYTQDQFKTYIEAVSNDIVDWPSIQRINADGGVTYGSDEIMHNTQAFEVLETNGVKFISGSNLCLNLKYFYRGQCIPPFYNPPRARGEDSFLATCLSEFRIQKVPVYTFHDGFLRYPSILKGVLPPTLEAIQSGQVSVQERFLKASIGWVRYKPLLLYITNRPGFKYQAWRIQEELKRASRDMAEYLEEPGFMSLEDEFASYASQVEEHSADFTAARVAWLKLNREMTAHQAC